jgi:death-on-curing protein
VTTARISFEAVERIAAAVGGGAVLDENGVRAVLGRPFSGSFDEEFYPSIWQKAAALLHGFATTQYLEDGNKRTAWVVAKTFLLMNDVRIPSVPAVQAEALMLATAAGSFPVDRVAEWLQLAHGIRTDEILDSRLEFLILAAGAFFDGATLTMFQAGLAGLTVFDAEPGDEVALPIEISVCGRIHWVPGDDGAYHEIVARLVEGAESGVSVVLAAETFSQMPVVPSGFSYQKSGRIPALFTLPLAATLTHVGEYVVELLIDGQLAGTKTIRLHVIPPLDSVPLS